MINIILYYYPILNNIIRYSAQFKQTHYHVLSRFVKQDFCFFFFHEFFVTLHKFSASKAANIEPIGFQYLHRRLPTINSVYLPFRPQFITDVAFEKAYTMSISYPYILKLNIMALPIQILDFHRFSFIYIFIFIIIII